MQTLLVDDDKNIRAMLTVSLKDLGCQVIAAASVDEAIQQLSVANFDLVLTDFRMSQKTGLDLLRELKVRQPKAVAVVMTAYASFENAVSVVREGAYDYLPKPFTNAQLKHVLEKLKTLVNLREENERLKKNSYCTNYFSGLTSPASLRLEQAIEKVSATDEGVLLVGESGTGKTELARLIHNHSPRADHAFTVVNCTSLTESLLEERFENASRGTLFFDEIGDLSLEGQARLLRFIQEKTSLTDTRVIAATRRNLAQEVLESNFREDLFYRLNAFECVLVSLRHRKEDIPILLKRFIPEARAIPDEVLQLLLNYSWPGNVRELRNVAKRLILLSAGREIQLDDLPDTIRKLRDTPAGQPEKLRTLEDVEREHIQRALASETSLEQAAEALGITTVTLWRKRREYAAKKD